MKIIGHAAIVWLAFLSVTFSSCTNGGGSGGPTNAGGSSNQPVVDASGKKIYTIDPSIGAVLTSSGISSSDPRFANVAVAIPSGALSLPVSVSLFEAQSLASPSTSYVLGANNLTAAGPTVAVIPSQSVTITGSLALSIPYSALTALTGDKQLVVIAIYPGESKNELETFVGDELDTSAPGIIKISAKKFGAFQVVYSDNVLKKKNVETTAEIRSITETPPSPRVPILSYAGSTGTAGKFGELMSVAPTQLENYGSPITGCGIKIPTAALPSWAAVNPNTCVISGTPTDGLSSTTYTLVATNSAGQSLDAAVTLSVNPLIPTLNYADITAVGAVGTPMSVAPTTLQTNGADITACGIKSGSPALPSWASVNATTCVISGTPNAILSPTSYTLVATNSAGQSADATVSLSVSAGVPTLSYSGASGTTGRFGVAMSVAPQILTSNGAAVTSCTIKSNSAALLPAWASIAGNTCVISGVPDAALSSTTYTIVAVNSVGQSFGANVTLSVEPVVPTLSFSGVSGTNGTVGVGITVTPSILYTNGAPIRNCWSKNALPSWATLNASTCVISGTPNAVLLSTTFTLIAENSAGNSSEATVSLSVSNVITPIAVEAFPDTTAYPAIQWTPNVRFSSAATDRVGLYSDTIGTLINTPVTASAGFNTFPAGLVSNFAQTTTVYAKNPLSSSYTLMGNYQTRLPPSISIPGVNSRVTASIRDTVSPGCTNAPNCVLIAGSFKVANGAYALKIARWNGTTLSALSPALSFGFDNVTALAFDKAGNLYVSTVNEFSGQAEIIKWDGSQKSLLGVLNGAVYALAFDPYGDLYAGGAFTTTDNVSTNYIVKYNSRFVGTVKWFALGTGMDNAVSALTFDASGNLYAGGYFTKAGGWTANRIAKWNGAAWSAMTTGFNGVVHQLAFNNNNLYAGGEFTLAGGVSANGIAKWDGNTWSALGTGMNNAVFDLAFDASNLYAAGTFTTAGGVNARRIAKWDGNNWSALGTGMDDFVDNLSFDGSGNLFAGGVFSIAGGVAASRVARWNGSTWSSLGTGTSAGFSDLIVGKNGDVYAGGGFTTIGGVNASCIAKWDGNTWSPLGTGMNGSVSALAIDSSGNLYAGGSFTNAGGVNASGVAKWDGNTWSPLGTGMNGSVSALAINSSGNLYAGGSFTNAGGVNANRIAKWDGNTWSALGTGIGDRAYDSINALAVGKDGNLYAGGDFRYAGGLNASHIARWDGTNWSTLGTGMRSFITGDGRVNSLAVDKDGNLYAGGEFLYAGEVSANRVAKWNGTTWSALGSGIGQASTAFSSVYALRLDSSGNLYAGGQFTAVGSLNANHVAKWNGANWRNLGTGMDGAVYALAVQSSGDIFAAGAFETAGSMFRPFIARWVSAFDLWY